MTATAPRGQSLVLTFTRRSLPRAYTQWLKDQPTRTRLLEGLHAIGLGDQADELIGILESANFGCRIGTCSFGDVAHIWKVLRLGQVEEEDLPWLKQLMSA